MPTITGTAVSGGAAPQASPLNVAYTVPATGARRCIVALVSAFDTTGTITGVTYGGQALTFVDRVDSTTVNGAIEIWRRLDPLTGSNTLSVAFSATMDEAYVHVFSAEDVNQTTPIGARTTVAFSTSTSTTLPTLTLGASDIGIGAVYAGFGVISLAESDTLILENDSVGVSVRGSQQGNAGLSWTHNNIARLAIGFPLAHDAGAAPLVMLGQACL